MGHRNGHEIVDIRCAPGELSFTARIGGVEQRVWMRTGSELTPNADAALAIGLLPAMAGGGTLSVEAPLSERLLRTQREFQAVQQAWSRGWEFSDLDLHEVGVSAPARAATAVAPTGRVAATFSGGVDSWSTIVSEPEVTDLVFVQGLDLLERLPQHRRLAGQVESSLREAAAEIGLPLHVVRTNLRELSDPLLPWEAYFGCAVAAVALFLAPLFDRFLMPGDADHEVQDSSGANRMVDQLLSTESLEIVDAGGRHNRVERTAIVAGEPAARGSLRVCWENPDGAYNCGRCRKCLMTMVTLEALGVRDRVATFPAELDLDLLATLDLTRPVVLQLWEDVLDAVREAARPDLERPVGAVVRAARRLHGLPRGYRGRARPGPPATVRIAAIVPAWQQAGYLAAAVDSALRQEVDAGVGVVIVDDGCPDPETRRIGEALRDAHPDRVAYLRQRNRGLPAARNAGIRLAFARWPHLDAIFPLDADNMLSPGALASLWELLELNPWADWASPTLEFFGAEDGEWRIPGPHLTYRQLFANQSDAGSLIRRGVFASGLEFDESMRDGFEDWEFFLRAGLAGFRGIEAGRCGFRYRRRPDSMLAQAQRDSAKLEAGLRDRHPDAYRPGELARREHAEAPRFALIRCDADDVLLTAACDLKPHRMPLAAFLRPRRAGSAPLDAHVPSLALLTRAATIEWLQANGTLAEVLLRLQLEVHAKPIVALRLKPSPRRGRPGRRRPPEPATAPAALAMRTRTLARLAPAMVPLKVDAWIEIEAGRKPPPPLAEALLGAAVATMRSGLRADVPLIRKGSQAEYFEYRHVDLLETTLPSTAAAVGEDLQPTL